RSWPRVYYGRGSDAARGLSCGRAAGVLYALSMAAPAATRPAPAPLPRVIGLYAATAITVGNIIGSGIFRSPHTVAQHLTTLPLVVLAWIVGGALSLCGSLALAELAVAHPETGGRYVCLREAFGDA